MNDGTSREPNTLTATARSDAAGSRIAGAGVDEVFPDGSEMAARMRAVDWDATGLGPVDRWPQSLRTAVRILLTSRFAMWMGWGRDLTFLYNDAYARMTLGKKHPWALGRPAGEVWAEIWRDIRPRTEQVMETGISTWDEGLLLFLERSGYAEETYHTFSYSPLSDDSGKIAGMLCVVTEETDRIIGARRLASLRELAASLATVTTEADVIDGMQCGVGDNRRDIPFSLLYLFDGDESAPASAQLAGSTGIDRAHPAAASSIVTGSAEAVWPAGRVHASGSRIVIDDLASRFDGIPTGAWDVPPRQAVVAPIAQPGQDKPAGFLVAAVNPYRQLDEGYLGFIDLVAGQIGASLANARAHERERRRAEALAELDRAKTQFFSNVSHEFRTPLTLILGPTEDMLASADTTPESRASVEVVHRNAIRLLKLVNTLLDFSRIEAGRIDAHYARTDLAALTTDLASPFRSVMEKAGLALSLDCQPIAAGVYVDRDMWEKIVLNLVSNAFKHTFEGGVSVTLHERAGSAELIVRDTGIGIAADQIPRLFERFFRVPNVRSRTHEGTGIGLALVHELVKLHGGSIAVDSAEGAGTTFVVRIPLGSAHLPAERVVAGDGSARRSPRGSVGALAYMTEAQRWMPNVSPPPAVSDARDADVADAVEPPDRDALDGARVLLVDDNADMRDYAARLLRGQGWVVETASDGLMALAAARRDLPDLVLSDVMMPGLDGFGLLRALRADARTSIVPIILLSARAGEEARVEGLDGGADDYLVKPFSAQELVARVRSQLTLARLRAAATAAIQEAHQQLALVLEHAPVAVAVHGGPEHVFELANPFYQQLCGRTDLIGRRFTDVFPEDDALSVARRLDHVYETGETYVGRRVSVAFDRTGNGDVQPGYFNFTTSPLRTDGRITGTITVAVEITDEVVAKEVADRARHEAEGARREAELANRAKSDFLAAMSHELRTPLNAIAGYVQLIQMGVHGPVTNAQHEVLERVQRSEHHLLSLINDVLNFVKVEAGRVEYDMRPVDLADVVSTAAPIVESQLEAKRIRFEWRVRPGTTVWADEDKLRQILLNLLTNAMKFTNPNGRVTIEVESSDGAGEADDSRDRVLLRVADTGIGIPAEKQEVIFDPFVQVHRHLTRNTDGTGLGLSISRDLARGMGADLRVASEVGQGSTFTLSLRPA